MKDASVARKRGRNRIRMGLGDDIFMVVNTILITLFAFICIYPFYYLFISSISSSLAISRGIYLLPSNVTLEAYKTIFKTAGIFQSAFISLMRTIIGTLLCVVGSAFCGYLFSQRDVLHRKLVYRIFIMTMYINAGFIPYYMVVAQLGLRNTFWVYVIPGAVSAYYIILVKTYIESLPEALQESAEIDGAGLLTIFARIIFPLSMPIIATLVVFCAVGQWNAWSDNMYFITDSKLFTLQYKLYQMLQNNMAEAMRANPEAAASIASDSALRVTPRSLRLAMTFVTVLPILCVYPFMQRYFVKGIMMGAVKG